MSEPFYPIDAEILPYLSQYMQFDVPEDDDAETTVSHLLQCFPNQYIFADERSTMLYVALDLRKVSLSFVVLHLVFVFLESWNISGTRLEQPWTHAHILADLRHHTRSR